MSVRWLLLLAGSVALLHACEDRTPGPPAEVACSEAWFARVDRQLQTADALGHGPDVGSDEWKSVVEHKLGLRGEAGVPPRDSDAWCQRVDEIIRDRR